MIELNKKYDVTINNEDDKGNGIIRIDGFVVFVPYTLKNEKVSIKITEVNKRYGVGEIISINSKSPCRCEISCDSYYNCGSCSFLHTVYSNEENNKINYIERMFNIKLDKVLFNTEYYYRNKATFHIKDNRIGYFSEKTHNLIDFDSCRILDDRINKIYKILKNSNLSSLNTIIVRTTKKEIMVIFDSEYDYELLLNKINIDSIYIKDKCVFGKKYITEEINNIKYTIYPESFFQINTVAIKDLYDVIQEYSGYGNKLLDLYCGTGSIGIYLKDNYKNITGIEINNSSILNANLNKEINNINNIEFILGDSKIAKNKKYDTVIVDPPRSGLSKEVINYLNKSNSKIIYVSCNPSTLKRDIGLLNNYKLDKLSIVNMFPKTKHIECVCILK